MVRALAEDRGLNGSAFDVRISRDEQDPEWDAFLAGCSRGHHEQTTLWARLKACYGWQAVRAVVRDGGAIVGGAQVLCRPVGALGRIGYVMRGPCLAADDPSAVAITMQQLNHVARSERLDYIVVVPPYDGRLIERALVDDGFRRKPDALPPGHVMTATLILDLSPDLDALIGGFRRTTRNNIRQASRAGVTVREGESADVETFRRLMWALCERRGTSPSPPQKDFFENLWRIFRPERAVQLFVAEASGRPVSAAIAFAFGNTVRVWKVGWTGEHAGTHANAMLWWEAIRWSKRTGFRYFDFFQIEENLARDLLSGRPVKWAFDQSQSRRPDLRSASFFKLGFGGTPAILPAPHYRFYHPAAAALMRCGASRLVESSLASGVAARLWGRLLVGEA